MRMAHQIVRLTDQFVAGKATHLLEGTVHERNAARRVRARNQRRIRGNLDFPIRDRFVQTHVIIPSPLCPRPLATKSQQAMYLAKSADQIQTKSTFQHYQT
ncbi:protein of unknown function [Rhodovastum atsumiense]|nr:protein of unknown function [Rhodovastum atsumiense]